MENVRKWLMTVSMLMLGFGVLASVFVGGAQQALATNASFKECTVIKPRYSEEFSKTAKKGEVGNAQIPVGWTPIGGFFASYSASGILICR